ncbi:hypothetical protein C8J57DRAFT_1679263, partial [Mycena rebaudengoi]
CLRAPRRSAPLLTTSPSHEKFICVPTFGRAQHPLCPRRQLGNPHHSAFDVAGPRQVAALCVSARRTVRRHHTRGDRVRIARSWAESRRGASRSGTRRARRSTRSPPGRPASGGGFLLMSHAARSRTWSRTASRSRDEYLINCCREYRMNSLRTSADTNTLCALVHASSIILTLFRRARSFYATILLPFHRPVVVPNCSFANR